MHLLPLIVDIDNANYQIYKKDCPINKKSAAKSLSSFTSANQAATVNPCTAGIIPGKATHYLAIAKIIDGWTSIIPRIICSLS